MISAWTSRKRYRKRLLVEAEAVLDRPRLERVEDPLLPVDQGAVAVGSHPRDVLSFGSGHSGAALWQGCRLPASDRLPPAVDLLEYQGKQLFARHDVRFRGAARDDRRRGRRRRGGDRLPLRGQGTGRDRRARQGRRNQGRRGRDEAAQHAEAILGMDIRGLHGPRGVGRGGLRHRRRVLRLDHPRPLARRSSLAMVSRMGGMDVEEVAESDPDALVRAHIDPATGFDRRGAPSWPCRGGNRRGRPRQVAELLVKLDEVATEDATLIEVNPLIVTDRAQVLALDAKVTIDGNALFRHPELAELTDALGRGPAGGDGEGEGPHLRQARRRHRHPRQRRRALHVDARRRRAGGRQAGQLPRRRRRLEGRGDRRRARGDHLGREGQGDPVQHLRRHHPLRRDRQGDHRGLEQIDIERAAGRPPRRHQLRGGPAPARRGRAPDLHAGEDDARRGQEGRGTGEATH